LFWVRLCLAIAGAALVIAGLRLSLPFARTGRPDTLRDFPVEVRLSRDESRSYGINMSAQGEARSGGRQSCDCHPDGGAETGKPGQYQQDADAP
jgi:hypothetical protein